MAVTRVADGQWHVLEDDLVVGRGHALRRPDGRLCISIDAWHAAAFDRLAEAMLTDLPAPPLHGGRWGQQRTDLRLAAGRFHDPAA